MMGRSNSTPLVAERKSVRLQDFPRRTNERHPGEPAGNELYASMRAASVVVRRKACVIRLMRERLGCQQMRLADRNVPNVGGTTGD